MAARGRASSRPRPALALLADRVATVRTLDFGADKTPPFLAGVDERGLALMLAHDQALGAQLRAILRAGRGTHLRILFPLVEIRAASRRRALVAEAATAVDGPVPQVGAMIETPGRPRGGRARAPTPTSSRSGRTTSCSTRSGSTASGRSRRPAPPQTRPCWQPRRGPSRRPLVWAVVEVCGEARGEPELAALLVGLGVRELSVSPARVDEVRARFAASRGRPRPRRRGGHARRLGAEALVIAAALVSGESGDERGEAVDGGGVVARRGDRQLCSASAPNASTSRMLFALASLRRSRRRRSRRRKAQPRARRLPRAVRAGPPDRAGGCARRRAQSLRHPAPPQRRRRPRSVLRRSRRRHRRRSLLDQGRVDDFEAPRSSSPSSASAARTERTELPRSMSTTAPRPLEPGAGSRKPARRRCRATRPGRLRWPRSAHPAQPPALPTRPTVRDAPLWETRTSPTH